MILDALFRTEERHTARVITGAGIDQDATLKKVFGQGIETTAGVRVDEEAAMGTSAYYCGIRLLSWGMAQLPLGVWSRAPNGDKEMQTERPEYHVLHNEANRDNTAMKLREIGQVMRLQWGRALNWIERDAKGRLKALWPLHTRDVRRERRPNGEMTYDITRCKDEDEFPEPPTTAPVLYDWEVLDVANFGGQSVLANAREEVGEMIAAQQLGAGFCAGGSLYAFAVKHPKKLGEAAQEKLRRALESVHGIRRRVPILEEGMELDKFGMPLKDAQFLDSRQWYITQVARWLNIQPHKLMDLSRATFSNIYEQRLEWLETLLPHLKIWNEEFTRKLFGADTQPLFVEHIVDGILQADIEKRYTAHKEAILNAFGSPNEARRRENWNTLGPAGDIVLVPQNMHIVPLTPEAEALYTKFGYLGTSVEQEEPVEDNVANVEDVSTKEEEPREEGGDKRSLRAVFQDRLRFAVSREMAEVRRAAREKKNFVGWLERFYGRQLERFASTIEPVAEACRLQGLAVDTESVAFQHCQEAHRGLLALTGEVTQPELIEAVERLTGDWEACLPAQLVEQATIAKTEE